MTTTAPCDAIYEKDLKAGSAIAKELEKQGICVRVYDESETERANEIVIYSRSTLNLSDNMPILENLGLCIEREAAAEVQRGKGERAHIKKYIVSCLDAANWKASKQNLSEVIEGDPRGHAGDYHPGLR